MRWQFYCGESTVLHLKDKRTSSHTIVTLEDFLQLASGGMLLAGTTHRDVPKSTQCSPPHGHSLAFMADVHADVRERVRAAVARAAGLQQRLGDAGERRSSIPANRVLMTAPEHSGTSAQAAPVKQRIRTDRFTSAGPALVKRSEVAHKAWPADAQALEKRMKIGR